MNRLVVLLILVGITGCSVSMDESTRADNTCVDTRDQSTFSFKGETMRNPQWSAALQDVCFDLTDDTGIHRTICKSHEVWLKCKPGFYSSSALAR